MADVFCESPSPTPGNHSAPAEVATLVASDSQAASSSASGSRTGSVNAPFIVVQFDDGPESGLIAETCEDDHCDPQFWRFQEVHSRPPKAKILFDDGVTLFIAELPPGLEGKIADEDGDEHSFIRAERPPALEVFYSPKKTKPGRPAGRKNVKEDARPPGRHVYPSSAATRRTGSGGYGHVTVEAVTQEDEGVDEVQLESAKRKRRKDRDEDWAPDRRKQRPAPGADGVAPPRTKRQKQVVASDSDGEAKSSGTAVVVAEPSAVPGFSEDDAAGSGQLVAADPVELPEKASCGQGRHAAAGQSSSDPSGVEVLCDGPANISGNELMDLPILAAPAAVPSCVLAGHQSDSDVEVCAEGLLASDGAEAAAQVALGASNEDDSDDFEMCIVK